MDIEKIAVVLRPRTAWEASDLGIALVRENWRLVYIATLIAITPVALCAFYFFWKDPLIAMLIIWWMKPLYDRVVLFILGRALFGEQPSLSSIFRIRNYFNFSMLLLLSFYRLLPNRSFALPVWDLEGLRGNKRSVRIGQLKRGRFYNGFGLTVVFIHLELVLLIGLIFLAFIFDPNSAHINSGDALYEYMVQPYVVQSQNVFYVLAVLVIEPFYVASGFAMYLNRRTIQEAWDVELAFRRLASSRVIHAH